MNNQQQESLKRFMNQLQQSGRRVPSGPGGRPPAGFLAGGGLIVALVAGGVLLNASLFNGVPISYLSLRCKDTYRSLVDGGHRAIKYTRCARFVL